MVLRCDEDELVWKEQEICRADYRCSFEFDDLGCTLIPEICRLGYDASCVNNESLTGCDENPVHPVPRLCPFGCAEDVCLPGSDDQLIVHTEAIQSSTVKYWSGDIAVCFLPSAADPLLRSLIRSEVIRSWGRFLRPNFTGWDDCADSHAGVAIEFLEECRLMLGNHVPRGSPGGEAQRRVAFCRTYYDAEGEFRTLTEQEAVARFLARHQFGHVIGLEDHGPSRTESLMSRGIHASRAAELLVGDEVAAFARAGYGPKPNWSLVTSGLCLGASTDLTRLHPSACTGIDSQQWILGLGEARNFATDPAKCLRVTSSETEAAVELADCTADGPGFALERAQLRSFAECVIPRRLPPAAGATLATKRCDAPDGSQPSWSVELQSVTPTALNVRIRLSDTDLCVTAPNFPAVFGDVLSLAPCGEDDARQVFRLRPQGQVAFSAGGASEFCLIQSPPSSVLYLGGCNFDYWFLSGALQSSGGLALSITPEDPDAELRATSLDASGLPRPEQVFDFHF